MRGSTAASAPCVLLASSSLACASPCRRHVPHHVARVLLSRLDLLTLCLLSVSGVPVRVARFRVRSLSVRSETLN